MILIFEISITDLDNLKRSQFFFLYKKMDDKILQILLPTNSIQF